MREKALPIFLGLVMLAGIGIDRATDALLALEDGKPKAEAPASKTQPAAAPGSLSLPKDQQQELELLQKDAIIAQQSVQMIQQQLNLAQTQAQNAYSKLTARAEALKAEHKMPPDTVFDAGAVAFKPGPVKPIVPPAQEKKN